MTDHADQDYRAVVRQTVLDDATFVQLTLKGKVRGGLAAPWRMILVRPVLVKGERHLQFSYFDQKQDYTKNYKDAEAAQKLDEALMIPYSAVHVRSARRDVSVQITKKGRVIMHEHPPAEAEAPDLRHDAEKWVPLPADRPDAFLHGIGIMNAQGAVRPDLRDKFHQINEFLKVLEHSGEVAQRGSAPLHIVDFGCGSAQLTLAAYHYLNHIKGAPAALTGIDRSPALVNKANATAARLGFADAHFYAGDIADFALIAPQTYPPDIVMALHACDTATDDALAQAVLLGAKLILAAPCCHHDLHQQLEMVDPFRPVLRHGILKKRMGDLLTDSFRALALRICGYRADVIEFISSEHTDRNLMIRAVLLPEAGQVRSAQYLREYEDLKAFWGVTPYIERLLGAEVFEV